MGVTSIEKSYGGDTGSWELERWKVSVQEMYEIETTDLINDHFFSVLTAVTAAVGNIGSAHPSYAGAYVEKVDLKRSTEQPLWWTAIYTYSNAMDFNPAEYVENPLNRPVKTKISFAETEYHMTLDLDSNEVKNSAGQPMILTVPDFNQVITLQQNRATLEHENIVALNGTVNDDCWGYWPKWSLFCVVDVDGPFFENNVIYWSYTWTLTYNWRGWNPVKLLDQGLMQLNDSNELVHIRDRTGQFVTEEQLLDGSGHAIPFGSPIASVYLPFRAYRESDFDNLIFVWNCEGGSE